MGIERIFNKCRQQDITANGCTFRELALNLCLHSQQEPTLSFSCLRVHPFMKGSTRHLNSCPV